MYITTQHTGLRHVELGWSDVTVYDQEQRFEIKLEISCLNLK